LFAELAGSGLYAAFSSRSDRSAVLFSWPALIVAAALHLVAINAGIGMGYLTLLNLVLLAVGGWFFGASFYE
jgi:hypothetical protein